MSDNPIILGSITGTPDKPVIMGSLSGAGASTPAPADADYLVKTANATLSAERVVTDTATVTWDWDTAGQAKANAVVPPSGNVSGSFIVSGGQVVWDGDLDFIVSAASYYIQGVLYTSAQQTVTLSAGNASNPRIDVIYLDTAGLADSIEGTPASDPSQPTVDPATQLALAFVLVEANATTPGNAISNLTLYAENAGATTEWNWTSSGSGWTFNSVTDPRSGTTHITGATVASAAYAQGQIGAGFIDINQYERLVIYVKVTSSWNQNRWLRVGWFVSGVQHGELLDIKDGAFGFDRTNTTIYQVIVMPTILFAVPIGTGVNQLRIIDNGGAISFRLDDILLQLANTSTQPVPGLTQAQADARYQRLPSFDTHLYALPFARR